MRPVAAVVEVMVPEIRRLEESEAETLSRLATTVYALAFGHSFAPEDLSAHLDAHLSPEALRAALNRDLILGAFRAGRPIGFVQFGALRDADTPPPAWEIRRLYVLPEYQRQRLGSLLMEAALSHPELMQAKAVFIDVWERNRGAQRLYRKFGFKLVGARKFIFASGREGDNDLIMVRNNIPKRQSPGDAA